MFAYIIPQLKMGERHWIVKYFYMYLYQLENVSVLHSTKEKNIVGLPEES